MMFDVSGLVPDAQAVALAVAEVYYKLTTPWFVGLTCFGSAVKGGILPGASDIDFHLYLTDGAFSAADTLHLDLAIAIHTELAQIDPAPKGISHGSTR